jgi:hypothetical protein
VLAIGTTAAAATLAALVLIATSQHTSVSLSTPHFPILCNNAAAVTQAEVTSLRVTLAVYVIAQRLASLCAITASISASVSGPFLLSWLIGNTASMLSLWISRRAVMVLCVW